MSKFCLDVETVVENRYSQGAKKRENSLCCPINYHPDLLKIIPKEILERDYGCGDPSRFLQEGETVLDLGCGGGKICYIASQIVGKKGKVIGVDINDDMLALARKYQKSIAVQLGYSNVTFFKGKICDLSLNYDLLGKWLQSHPMQDENGYISLQKAIERFRLYNPMIRDTSIDAVISNCVLNLVPPQQKQNLFNEIYRVLRKGGRAIISDIVSDEDVPLAMQNNAKLWSGCISGALREDLLLRCFEEAGFYGIQILSRDPNPWKTIRGIEFRSITVEAFKGKEGECWERNQAVIYKGPFRKVVDDDGHTLVRGKRMAVCEKTYQIYQSEPYKKHFYPVPPRRSISLSKAKPFNCTRETLRHPKETKGLRVLKMGLATVVVNFFHFLVE